MPALRQKRPQGVYGVDLQLPPTGQLSVSYMPSSCVPATESSARLSSTCSGAAASGVDWNVRSTARGRLPPCFSSGGTARGEPGPYLHVSPMLSRGLEAPVPHLVSTRHLLDGTCISGLAAFDAAESRERGTCETDRFESNSASSC